MNIVDELRALADVVEKARQIVREAEDPRFDGTVDHHSIRMLRQSIAALDRDES